MLSGGSPGRNPPPPFFVVGGTPPRPHGCSWSCRLGFSAPGGEAPRTRSGTCSRIVRRSVTTVVPGVFVVARPEGTRGGQPRSSGRNPPAVRPRPRAEGVTAPARRGGAGAEGVARPHASSGAPSGVRAARTPDSPASDGLRASRALPWTGGVSRPPTRRKPRETGHHGLKPCPRAGACRRRTRGQPAGKQRRGVTPRRSPPPQVLRATGAPAP